MKALMKKELRLSRNILFVWLGMILLLCGFSYFEYLSLKDSLEDLTGFIDGFPEILKVMFGVSGDLSTALGWYGCIYFWVAIFGFAYAVYLGITCVAKEREQGTAEFLFTKPVSRRQIVFAKAAACVCNLFALAVFSGVCNYFTAVLPLGGLENRGAVVVTVIGMFLTETALFSLALLASALAKTYQKAVRLGAGMLLGFYAVYLFAEYQKMPMLYYLTPLKYFDVYAVAQDGIRGSFLLITAVIVLGSVLVAERCWGDREVF